MKSRVVGQIDVDIGVGVERFTPGGVRATIRAGGANRKGREVGQVHVAVAVKVAKPELIRSAIDPAAKHASVAVEIDLPGGGRVAGVDGRRVG